MTTYRYTHDDMDKLFEEIGKIKRGVEIQIMYLETMIEVLMKIEGWGYDDPAIQEFNRIVKGLKLLIGKEGTAPTILVISKEPEAE